MAKINEQERNLQQRQIWRVTSCCISKICQKRLVGGCQWQEAVTEGWERTGEVISSGVGWQAVNYTGKEPWADAVLDVGPSLLHRLSARKELQLATGAWAWQSQRDFFFWLCHSPILPSSITGLRQKRWALCSVFLSFLRWSDKKARLHGPVTGAEIAVWKPERPLSWPLSQNLCVGRRRHDSQGLGPVQVFQNNVP